MPDLLRELLAGRADRLALISPRLTLTFGGLRQRVQSVAESLFSSSGRRLMFCFLPNSLTLITAYLSALTSGNAVAVLPETTSAPRKRALIESYRPDLVLAVGGDLGEFLAATGYRRLPPAADDDAESQAWLCAAAGDLAADLALLLSTSGSTGTPKLVRLSTANIARNATGIVESLGISPDQRAVTSVPLSSSYGLSVVSSHLAAGSCVVITDQSPVSARFWRLVHDHAVTTVAGTPLMHRAILGDWAIGPPPSVKVMTQAGGRLPETLTRKAVTWMAGTGGRFFCMYGQTEATSRISCLDASLLAEKIGSVGTALPGGHISVGPPGPDGSGGAISYSGPNVMMGYACCRNDLARGVETSLLDTGDRGTLDRDGFLYVTGRSSRFVKVMDRRVSLDDVEEWFSDADDCAAVALPGEGAAAIAVYAVGRPGRLEQARRALAAALGAPTSAILLRSADAIPRTVSGKVDYARLADIAARPVNREAL